MTNSYVSRHADLTEMALHQDVGFLARRLVFASFLSSVLHWALDDTQDRRIFTHFHYFANINHLPRCCQQYCAMFSPSLCHRRRRMAAPSNRTSPTNFIACFLFILINEHSARDVIFGNSGCSPVYRLDNHEAPAGWITQVSWSEYDFLNFVSVGIFNYLCVHLSEKEKIAMLV